MVLLDWRSGLRRAELANFLVRDVHDGAVIVRGGKNKKDRMVPLPSEVAARLHEFIKNKNPDERVLGLTLESLGMKIKQFAGKAGLNNFHTHTLRHKFATDVLESGTNLKVLQTLLGHENLNTTEVYLSLTDRELYAAAKRLEGRNANVPKVNEQEKHVQQVSPVPANVNVSLNDPWAEALKVAMAPKNLCQALQREQTEEVPLTQSPVIDKKAADYLLKLLQNNARLNNH
jgi:hypothetical protein